MKKRGQDVLVFFIFLLITSAIILIRELNNLDEIWIFNMARNIANGLLPYKEFNLIITPGLPIMCGILLKLFGTELFVMRVIASIVSAIMILVIYKILQACKISKNMSMLMTIFVLTLFIDSLCIDYNFLVLLIALIILYIELKVYDKNKDIFEFNLRREILLGILAGVSITLKQTTGMFFSIVFIGYKLLGVRSKDNFKQFLKIAIIRCVAVLIPVIILLIYLLYNNIMNDFIDYAIIGLKDFSNSIPYSNLLKGNLSFFAILIPITIIVSLYLSIKNKDNRLLILSSYSISTVIVVYPISDSVHFLIAVTIGILTGIYLLKYIYDKTINNKLNEVQQIWIQNFIKAITIMVVFIFIAISAYKIIVYAINIKNYPIFNNFKYIPISEELGTQIVKIDEYIAKESNQVYILDARAAIYMIPMNRYNKDYDMIQRGNLGSKGSQGIIEELQARDDITLLILKDERYLNWQTPRDIINYIKENYTKCGEVEIFNIYKK